MKATIKVDKEVEIAFVRIQVAVRYGEEDIPNDFPMRNGKLWDAKVNIDTGAISDWPSGKCGSMHMKVCDEGTYTLFDNASNQLAALEGEYVPHGVVPGEYGDYIILDIDNNGVIANWPKNPDVHMFFGRE